MKEGSNTAENGTKMGQQCVQMRICQWLQPREGENTPEDKGGGEKGGNEEDKDKNNT